MNSHEDGSSWFMKCELGAESLRPRWGRWVGGLWGQSGGGFAWHKQPSVCRRGWRRHDLPSPPTSSSSTATTTTSTTLWLPACSLIHRGLWHSCSFWLLTIRRNPAGSSCGDQRLGFDQPGWEGWLKCTKCPQLAAADACCVSAPVVRLHLCHTAGWWSAESSIKSASILLWFQKNKGWSKNCWAGLLKPTARASERQRFESFKDFWPMQANKLQLTLIDSLYLHVAIKSNSSLKDGHSLAAANEVVIIRV